VKEVLGCNTEPAKLSFKREIINLEFVEQVGNIDIQNNSQKRNKMLLRHGKKLFNKFRQVKEETISPKAQGFEIDNNIKSGLTQEEIKTLIASVAEEATEPSEENTGKTLVLSKKEMHELLSPIETSGMKRD
jgi:hypothetical protein